MHFSAGVVHVSVMYLSNVSLGIAVFLGRDADDLAEHVEKLRSPHGFELFATVGFI